MTVHGADPLLGRATHAEALLVRGQFADAAGEFTALLALRPDWSLVRLGAIRSLLSVGDPDAAQRIARHPAMLDDRVAISEVLRYFRAFGAWRHQAALLHEFADRHPGDAEAALALASALHALGRPGEAIRWADRTIELKPDADVAREIRATSLIDRGDVEAGIDEYRALIPRGDAATAARFLVLMHYDPAQTNDHLFDQLDAYARQHLRSSGPAFVPAVRKADRPLRVGWISPRIAAGPVATFLTDLLTHFDRMRFTHVLVDLTPAADTTSVRLRALADEVVEAAFLDDDALLTRLRDSRLDIAIDLAGHSTANRLVVLAQRVAPLQICWLDWFDTTAAPAMDAWISDAWLTPLDSTQRYSERLVRLAAGRFSYSMMADVDSTSRRTTADPVVFASFNRLAKFNDAVVDTWVQVLQRVPDAVLALRARLLDDPDTRRHMAQRFAARGIGIERLDLGGALPYRDLLDAYRGVDIALDPFPFSGCTTTCDALWMGCPVITLAGETFVSRQSASLAWRLGQDEWIARDRNDYVERAVALAADVDALRNGRAQLRLRVCDRLCNAAEQATEFAQVLAELHAEKCGMTAPRSLQ